ncbi:MAG: inosine/xanthosine triphosphatase [Calditrichaeota bacterium]|nr:inosine/xanthosine triphosphatase [Calditrichota bacterium]MCB0314313.1 inosine/xanthosine triphosphatase [Calditrichota bacterium]
MQQIILASHNPVKVQAVLNGFRKMFPGQLFTLTSANVPSGVADQPTSEGETLQGAHNRAEGAFRQMPQADYWVGIEGGVSYMEDEMIAFAWIVIKSRDGLGKSRTGTFFLPPQIADLVGQGLELGDADDQVFQQKQSKQKQGAIGLLTGNVIDRARLYEHAIVLALVPFKNAVLYELPVE